MKPVNSVLSAYGTTVFEVVSRLALEHQSINLGQGFPDEDGPDSLKQALQRATCERLNQYPPLLGVPELRAAVARHAERHYGLRYDPDTEVLITAGATEALAASLLALIEPGDEVILLEPAFDIYRPLVERAGGIPRPVALRPPDWALPRAELEAAFSDRTKLLVLNTPMNPIAKVFTADELAWLGERLVAHDAYAVCDEVYEHLVFDQRPHVPLATMSGLFERCIRIGSAGKTFSMTSWKVGLLCAPTPLLAAVAKAHQFLVFTIPANLQYAVAHGLDHEQAWYAGLAGELQHKRDRLAAGLERLGFGVLPSAGSYFLNADIRPLGFADTDMDFCRRITVEAGVTAVPVSAFYSAARIDHLVRFCFCKRPDVLEEALVRLGRFLGRTT
ncbi:MAG: aminotransferase [Candidatus Competibacterales bacterium]|nr:aminotransferase [Candidatus Competibacterales bacterium]